MRHGLASVWILWLVSTGPLLAQAPAEPKAAQPAQTLPEPADANAAAGAAAPANVTMEPPLADSIGGYRIWARTDFLLWWVRPAPVPVPIVTTGDPRVGFNGSPANAVNTAGAIGQPGTQVLLGQGSMPFSPAPGIRSALGGWIDDDQCFGIEGAGFWLARQSSSFSAASNTAGNPPLYFPIFSAIADAERAIPIADPLRGFSGSVAVSSSVQLWGAEVNGLYAFFRDDGLQMTLLFGGRYANLGESLQIHNTTQDLIFGNITTLSDSFRTRNQFYGGQIGTRIGVQMERFFMDCTGKIALGETRQLVAIGGDITQLGPNPLVPPGLGAFPGGLFAQSTNVGQHNTSPLTVPFSTLLSLELRLGYAITPWLRAFAGYDILFWTNVVRPGDQINHIVNLSQNAVLDPNGVGRLVGPAQPAFLFNRNDFWAQGISFGLEWRY